MRCACCLNDQEGIDRQEGVICGVRETETAKARTAGVSVRRNGVASARIGAISARRNRDSIDQNKRDPC